MVWPFLFPSRPPTLKRISAHPFALFPGVTEDGNYGEQTTSAGGPSGQPRSPSGRWEACTRDPTCTEWHTKHAPHPPKHQCPEKAEPRRGESLVPASSMNWAAPQLVGLAAPASLGEWILSLSHPVRREARRDPIILKQLRSPKPVIWDSDIHHIVSFAITD